MINCTQRQIESLYDLAPAQAAENFLLSQEHLQELLPGDHPFLDADEVVIAQGDFDAMEIGIYFHPQILATMEAPSFHHRLCMMEGVSHYLLFTHKHSLKIPVSKLELETQAEIDKFLLLVLDEYTPMDPDRAFGLMQKPFNLKNMHGDQHQLYAEASYLAQRYCYGLIRQYFANGNKRKLLNHIRNFYRLPHQQKLQCILTNTASLS